MKKLIQRMASLVVVLTVLFSVATTSYNAEFVYGNEKDIVTPHNDAKPDNSHRN